MRTKFAGYLVVAATALAMIQVPTAALADITCHTPGYAPKTVKVLGKSVQVCAPALGTKVTAKCKVGTTPGTKTVIINHVSKTINVCLVAKTKPVFKCKLGKNGVAGTPTTRTSKTTGKPVTVCVYPKAKTTKPVKTATPKAP